MSGPHKQVKLNVRVPPQVKEKWKEATDDGESFKDLVVRAMNREVNEEYVHQTHIQQNIDLGDVDFGALGTRLDGIENELKELRADLDETVSPATSETQLESLDQQSIESLAADVHNHLPLVDSEEIFTDQDVPLTMDSRDRAKVTGFLEDITLAVNDLTEIDDIDSATESDLRYNRIHVREALLYLQNNTTAKINSLVDDSGKRRWYELK